MSRTIELCLQIRSTPDQAGWLDTILLCYGPHLIFAAPARGGPNWTTPFGSPWHVKYDCIAPGDLQWQYLSNHPKYAACLLLNGGEEVPSRNPRPNPDGSVFTEVFAHCAQSDIWPGSSGCITLQPVFWRAFISLFEPGDAGVLHVKDYLGEPGWRVLP